MLSATAPSSRLSACVSNWEGKGINGPARHLDGRGFPRFCPLLLQHNLVVILQHVTQRGDAQCREHPLRHVSPSILVTPDVVAVSIGLVTFYLYAEDGVCLVPVSVESALAQLRSSLPISQQ